MLVVSRQFNFSVINLIFDIKVNKKIFSFLYFLIYIIITYNFLIINLFMLILKLKLITTNFLEVDY